MISTDDVITFYFEKKNVYLKNILKLRLSRVSLENQYRYSFFHLTLASLLIEYNNVLFQFQFKIPKMVYHQFFHSPDLE